MSPGRVGRVAPRALEALRAAAIPLAGRPADLDPLLERIGGARFVLVGESTHGTHEFYRERALLTRRLVEERGFRAVAIEGDWPDAYRVNRYVRGLGADADARAALSDFRRFPAWMWRNADVLEFVAWLRGHNERARPSARCGFYGLDLYSLHASMEAVLRYLDDVDPDGARRARARYACFERFGDDAQAYGYAASLGIEPTCEDAVVTQLVEMRARGAAYVAADGRFDPDDHFHAAQNARLVRDAERYYRTMFRGRERSWNLRDEHMADTLGALARHLDGTGPAPARVVVWAHNSHVGDARATEMSARGEWNVGQLARERFGAEAFLVGQTTHHGTVTAARDWDGPAERRRVRAGLLGSYESLFHETGIPRFLLFPRAAGSGSRRGDAPGDRVAPEPLLERMIGVVYRPETERQSHYFESHLSGQFDALLHFDETRAVEPLERSATWEHGEPPDTYPTGL
jgi:erythromycin esterase-like protein